MANEIDWGQGAKNNAIGWGQGASNNSIGWGLSHFDSPSGETEIYGIRQDAAVSAFLTATGITDTTITSALEDLVADLKSYSIWDKMKAIYPFVGGTATTHKFNLKDARDTDAAFRLAFNGGVTHSSNGIQGNGTNGYANTFLTPSATLSQNSTHVSLYSRTDINTLTFDMGSANAGLINGLNFTTRSSNNTGYYTCNGTQFSTASPSSVGYYMMNRTASNLTKVFKNNNLAVTNTTLSTGLNNSSIYILGLNVNNALNYVRGGSYSFSTIGDGLTDEDSANLYYSVQKFQTTLGRQVGTPIYSSNATDVNARLFLGATNIQDATITSAVDTLVQGLKTDGIWSKLKAVYPFVGGTATTHKFNLANALDEDSAFRLSFSGGWTHSSNGATPNGTNGYANTFLTPSTSLSQNSSSHGYYSRTNITSGSSIDMGSAIGNVGAGNKSYIIYKFAGVSYITCNNVIDYPINTISDTRGFLVANRPNSTQLKSYFNATAQTLAAPSTGLSSIPIFIGAYNRNSITTDFSSRQCAFSFIGDGLTDTEASNLYTRVQAFQTTLNRQV
jgi:hypothetical protein